MAYLLQLGQVSGGRHLGHQPQEPGIGTEEVETVESFYSSPLPSYFKVYLVIPAVALKFETFTTFPLLEVHAVDTKHAEVKLVDCHITCQLQPGWLLPEVILNQLKHLSKSGCFSVHVDGQGFLYAPAKL